MCRIILAMVAAYGRCFRAQPPTNVQGASEHSRTQVTAAELFYLRHLRSCAASASGSKSTSSGVTSNLCIPGELVMLEVLMSVIVPVVQSMLRFLRSAWTLLQYIRKLVPHPSPLEMVACAVVVDACEAECQGVQTVLAAFVLFLAVCDWHISPTMPHHHILCRLLSAMCMHALYPTSATLMCCTLAYTTFGKRAATTAASAPRDPDSGYGASEHVPTRPDDKMSLDDVIAKFEAMDGITKHAETILEAAITLRDNSGRDQKQALRKMAATWNVARYYKVDDKRKDRSVLAVAKDLEAAVCDAALKWGSDSCQKASESKTRGAAEHMETPPPK